jgi:hypothetical protein
MIAGLNQRCLTAEGALGEHAAAVERLALVEQEAREAAQRRQAKQIATAYGPAVTRLRAAIEELAQANARVSALDTIIRGDFDVWNPKVRGIDAHLDARPYPGGLEFPVTASAIDVWFHTLTQYGW